MRYHFALENRRHGPLTAGLHLLLRMLRWISPVWWLGRRWPSFRDQEDLTLEQIRDRKFTRKRIRDVDLYVLIWLVVELILVGIYEEIPVESPWSTVVGVVAVLRIIEVLRVALAAALFDQILRHSDNRVVSSPRLIVLGMVNFFELILCYGLVYTNSIALLKNASTVNDALYFSGVTQLTVGFGDVVPSGFLREVMISQGLAGFVIAILVLGRLVGSLPQVRTRR